MDDHGGEFDDHAGHTCCGACREGRIGTGTCASATNGLLRPDIVTTGDAYLARGDATRETGPGLRSGRHATTIRTARSGDQE